jgi:hypothetical protein
MLPILVHTADSQRYGRSIGVPEDHSFAKFVKPEGFLMAKTIHDHRCLKCPRMWACRSMACCGNFLALCQECLDGQPSGDSVDKTEDIILETETADSVTMESVVGQARRLLEEQRARGKLDVTLGLTPDILWLEEHVAKAK